ncbi:MAG: IS3 family transposase [Caldimonas sp.]
MVLAPSNVPSPLAVVDRTVLEVTATGNGGPRYERVLDTALREHLELLQLRWRPPRRIRDIAMSRPRFGYLRVLVMLKREGWQVGKKRVYRLY